MGTQTAIAQQIQDSGADYILTLKANHPTLAEDARGWFEQHQDETDDTALNITEFICSKHLGISYYAVQATEAV